jgi:replicative DNA helicase
LSAIGRLLGERYQRLRRLYETGEPVTGIPSGLFMLDRLTGGFQPGQLTLVVAEYLMGKSSFLLSVAADASRRHQIVTAVLSATSSASELTDRLLAIETGINSAVLERARLSPGDWVQLTAACEALADAPLYLNDTPGLSPDSIDTLLGSTAIPIRLLLVDDLQTLVAHDTSADSLLTLAAQLRRLAAKRQVAIVATLLPPPQTRECESGRILVAELRRSGLLAAADLVVLLDRDQQALREDEQAALAELILLRNRNGSTDTVRVRFQRQCGRFANLS